MSRKNSLVTQLINPTNGSKVFSLATSFTSPATVVRFLDNCSYQINVTTSDSSGVFQVQVSNDYYVNEGNDSVVSNPGTWIPITLAGGAPTVAGADTDIAISLNQLPYYGVRLAYTSSVAGTGTCTIFVTDKAI